MTVVSPESETSAIGLNVSQSDENGFTTYVINVDNDLGHLVATFDGITSIFDIEWIQTGVPRQGLGKLLLRKAFKIAEESEAELITAAIVKRQCLDDVNEVFGTDSVHVKHLGDYDKRNTSAVLYYYFADHQE